jgi:DNA-directed RNA polymerase subunit beta
MLISTERKKLPVTTYSAIGFERDKDILEILTLLKIKLKFQQKYIGRKLAACIKYMA